MKAIVISIFVLFSHHLQAKSDWTKYLPCPNLAARYLPDGVSIEIETIETTKENLIIDACEYHQGGECFKLIPKKRVTISSAYDFKISSIEIQMENYYDKVCSYEISDI